MASQLLMMAPPAPQQLQPQSQVKLTEAQSLALVKIFLNSSLACICHTRELIDWQSSCFRKRYIDHIQLEDEHVYDSFRDHEPASPGSSQEVRVLVRGRHSHGNSILDMIENGVFEAIEKGYLDTLQVFVTTNSGNSHTIRETYTYSFSYYGNAVASVELKEQQQHLSLSDAQRSLKAAIRCLLRAVKDLPHLPGKRSLGMSIAYNDNCPKTYDPAGFVDAAHHTILQEDWDKLWNGTGQSVSSFDSTHHAVGIAARNATFGYQTASQIQDTALSKQLENLQKTSSGRHPGLVSTLPEPITSPLRPSLPRSVLAVDALHSPLPSPEESKSRNIKTRSTTRSQPLTSQPDSGDLTGDLKNPLRRLVIAGKSRREREIIPAKIAEAVVHAHCLDFDAQDGTTLFDPQQLEQGIIHRIGPSINVRCECGYQQACEPMVFCHLCNSHQHSACYGLNLIVRQKSVPKQHLCYSCLLLPKEEDTLKSMAGLVRMRLGFIHMSSLHSAKLDLTEFFRHVFGTSETDEGEMNALVQRLVTEEILSKPENGVAKIRPLSADKLQTIQAEYLDPLAAVSHLYRVVKDRGKGKSAAAEFKIELQRYSNGCDYTAGQGVEDVVVTDSLGEPVVRWGYYTNVLKRKATMEVSASPSPRRRRISVSRAFIKLDRSTPASSLSMDEEAPYGIETGAVSSDQDARSQASISTDTDF